MVNRRQEYLEVFLDEIREMLSKWETIVSDPGFLRSKDLLSELFRVIHSIKGASGTMGLNKLSSFVHHVEDLIEYSRVYPQAVDSRFTDMIEHCREILVSWVETMQLKPEASEILPDISGEIKRIISKEFSDTVTMQLEAGVSDNSHQAQSLVNIKDADVPTKLKVSGEQIDSPPSIPNKGKLTPVSRELPDKSKNQDPVSFIRIGMEKIDHLFRIVGELSIQNEILYHAWESGKLNSELASSSVNLINKGMTELQDQAFSLRMQPVKPIFVSLQRAAFDVSRTLGKKIKVMVEGEEEEFDKSLLEFMKLPLTHIVRNAVDHGIEPLTVRRKLGKPDVSLLKMSAEPHSGGVIIKISDDGKGLSPDFIKKKALEKGFLNQEDEISDDRALQLIFLPGFSTAAKITDVSGRGVGMDVVKVSIEKLGGNIEVKSFYKQGTEIFLRLPLTLAIIPCLIIECEQQIFAIPQVNLEELIALSETDAEKKLEMAGNMEVFRSRNTLLPIVRLSQILKNNHQSSKDFALNPSGEKKSRTDQILYFAVLKSGDKRFGLVVDHIIGTEEVVISPMHSALKDIHIYSGATVRGDGQVSLILDAFGISEFAGVSGAEDTSSVNHELPAVQTDLIWSSQDEQPMLLLGAADL